MTWPHVCPRCGATSLRHCIGDRKPVCAHEYHAAEDCGLCGSCRTGWTPLAIFDASGRYLGQEPSALMVREPGPHNSNLDAREPVKE